LIDLPSSPTNKTGWMWTEVSPQLPDPGPDSHLWPRITIVTPSFNQGRFLEETIRSILFQGYPHLEYIIIDGGSNDNSVDIIKKYEPYLAYWVSEKDRGQAHAINKGFARASGDIYAYLNSDDFFEHGALHSCAQAFRAGHQWVVGQVQCWQEGVGYWPFPQLPGKSFTKWFLSCPIPQAGSFWSAELHHEMGQFSEDLNYIIDYEFWLRLRFIKKIKPFFIDKPIAVYRIHPESKIQRGYLWAARRHRLARIKGKKAVSFFKKGEFRAATRCLMSALVVWPLLAIDFHGFLLAFKKLSNLVKDEPDVLDLWPELDD
jgi:glycosyltransferase involved in cell wall biosynthesis